jgi:hypothetical protein
MNIKSRIFRLEKDLCASGSCDCADTQRIEIYTADLTADLSNRVPLLSGDSVLGFCELCRKPIDKKQITIEIVDREELQRQSTRGNNGHR